MRNVTIYCLVCLLILSVAGCGKKADENKTIGEVRAEADKMSVAQLRDMALKYKDAISAKQSEIDKVMAQLKEVPITKALGEEAKGLKGEIDNLMKSTKALNERFQVYYNKLKEQGGDVSGLEI
jgi:acyl-CoA reductase-like NAD-dependent aldehyde dehydrogenase